VTVRIFVAGASGVIGVRLVPLLVGAGHDVAGMTRSSAKVDQLRTQGAEPVLCDVYDADALGAAVTAFRPDLVMQQLTDLPDDITQVVELGDRNDRMWREGTRNLLAATEAAGARQFFAQSIAWELPAERGDATRQYEKSVLDAGGVVIRYGQLYGPDTYYPTDPPPPPRIHIDDAARRTVTTLDSPPGIVDLVE
jgi:nucleoside-diphosphate-sugar epimerase